jgi:hypothetical protein
LSPTLKGIPFWSFRWPEASSFCAQIMWLWWPWLWTVVILARAIDENKLHFCTILWRLWMLYLWMCALFCFFYFCTVVRELRSSFIAAKVQEASQ